MFIKDVLLEIGVCYDTVCSRFSNNESLLHKFVFRFPSDDTYNQIKLSVDNKDYDNIERHAHTLKGIASNLGFENLSRLSSDMMTLSRARNVAVIGETFSNLTEEYQKIISYIKRID